MRKALSEFWLGLRAMAARHREPIAHAHHVMHLTYFALVATHGPYYWPAAACFVLGLVAWVFHIPEGLTDD